MVFKYTLLSLLFLNVLGCTIEEETPPAAPLAVPGETVNTFRSSDVSYEIVPLEEPNLYAIEIAWPKTDLQVLLRRNTETKFTLVQGSMNSFRYTVAGGTKARIEIEARKTENSTPLEQFILEVSVPTDWVVSGKHELSENMEVNCGRLFLKEKAILQINNLNLKVRCEELVSDDGTIMTFPESQVAKDRGLPGRNGGEARLHFKKARGKVSLSLNGESGSAGRNGYGGGFSANEFEFGDRRIERKRIPGCRGQNGGNGGSTGSVYIELENSSELSISAQTQPGNGGLAGEMIAKEDDKEAINNFQPGHPLYYESCIPDGGRGTPGINGGLGEVCVKVGHDEPDCNFSNKVF